MLFYYATGSAPGKVKVVDGPDCVFEGVCVVKDGDHGNGKRVVVVVDDAGVDGEDSPKPPNCLDAEGEWRCLERQTGRREI